MTINEKLSQEIGIKLTQVEAAVELLDAGNTVPFISRYRKEVTGGLDDEQLRRLTERLTYLRNLEEKREDVKKLLYELEGRYPDLKKHIFGGLQRSPLPGWNMNDPLGE